MWKCKECGGTDFKAHLDSSISSGIVVGGYEKYSGYGKDGYPLELEESDYETNVECEKCGFIDSGISLIADWEEEDERD